MPLFVYIASCFIHIYASQTQYKWKVLAHSRLNAERRGVFSQLLKHIQVILTYVNTSLYIIILHHVYF